MRHRGLIASSWDAFGLPENMSFAVREGLLSHCQQVLFQYLHSIHTHFFPLSPDHHLYEIVQPASISVQCVSTVKLEGSHMEWAHQWLCFSCLGQPTKPSSSHPLPLKVSRQMLQSAPLTWAVPVKTENSEVNILNHCCWFQHLDLPNNKNISWLVL